MDVPADKPSPVDVLLKADEEKNEMLRALGRALEGVDAAHSAYREAWRSARGTGWARADLVRAGFIDPARLPRGRRGGRDSGGAAVRGGGQRLG